MLRRSLIVFLDFEKLNLQFYIWKQKAHKNGGIIGLTSDHVINAGDDCFVHLALLFFASVVHDILCPVNFHIVQ